MEKMTTRKQEVRRLINNLFDTIDLNRENYCNGITDRAQYIEIEKELFGCIEAQIRIYSYFM